MVPIDISCYNIRDVSQRAILGSTDKIVRIRNGFFPKAF